MRLLGFKPGESSNVKKTADPRLLARFNGSAGKWRIAGGTYRIALGQSADWSVGQPFTYDLVDILY